MVEILIAEALEMLFIVTSVLMTAYLARHYIFTLTVLKNSQKRHQNNTDSANTAYQPEVTVLIPACDEQQVIGRLLKRMTELTYPKSRLQIIVIDDASKDNTGRIAEEYSNSNGYIRVTHRSEREGRRGKASALNAGLKHATGKIILCFDADYYPQKDILERLTQEFVDPKIGAVQGRVTVLNEPQNLVTRLVALERTGGYCIDQQARDSLGLIPQFGGTVGGLRRDVLDLLGGWDETMSAEDTDLTFRVYLAGYKIRYVNDAECYEEAVESWRAYWKQRHRWAFGHMQCAFRHSLKVLKSEKLILREKIDGLLLLNVYFMPILALLSWNTFVLLLYLKPSQWLSTIWILVSIPVYSFVGNFAPFFEVGIGAYLDGRKRAHWLISLLVFTFLYNIPICTKALADLLISMVFNKRANRWEKTPHSGKANKYLLK